MGYWHTGPIPHWAADLKLAEVPVDPLPFGRKIRYLRIGGSRRVVLATSAGGEQRVVLKLLGASGSPPESVSGMDILRSIQRAGDIRAAHPALTRLLGVRWVPGYGYVTLNEYVEQGESVAMPLDQMLAAATGVLGALDHIHGSGSAHGDIYDGNVVVTAVGAPFVIDYDVAGRCAELRRTRYPASVATGDRLSAWQEGDMRAFGAILVHWLEERRATLIADPYGNAAELTRIQRLLRGVAMSAPLAGMAAAQINDRISALIRRAA